MLLFVRVLATAAEMTLGQSAQPFEQFLSEVL